MNDDLYDGTKPATTLTKQDLEAIIEHLKKHHQRYRPGPCYLPTEGRAINERAAKAFDAESNRRQEQDEKGNYNV